MKADSVDKIVQQYFASVTAEPFEYKGKRYEVPRLMVSPLLLRGYTCPAGCGGCCRKFTLDYLPDEKAPGDLRERRVEFNGVQIPLYTDFQAGNSGDRCKYLIPENGRCGIYPVRPFSCDFELIKFVSWGESARLSQHLFARGWNMKRTDGGRGAKCEMLPATPETVDEVVRKLGRLQQWGTHFRLRTRVPHILDWVHQIKGDLLKAEPLILPAREDALW